MASPVPTRDFKTPDSRSSLEFPARKDVSPRSPERRLGVEKAERRRLLESRPQRFGSGRKWLPLQMLEPLMESARHLFELCGLYSPFARRTTRLQVVERAAFLHGLPPALEGVRILHLSDLHIDGCPDFGRSLAERCSRLEFDYVCLTGDLRLSTRGSIDRVLTEMKILCDVLCQKAPVFAVLGNHDALDLVAPLESFGVTYLLNESKKVAFRETTFFFAGVDDAHYYGTDDLDRALEDVPVDAPTVLLVHSPDLIHEAAEESVNFYLCGHTHGGQLCLPGGLPLVSNASCSRRFARGAWRLGAMAGYTSSGAGFSGIPLRTFCPGEIVIHTLRRERRRRARMALEAAEGRV